MKYEKARAVLWSRVAPDEQVVAESKGILRQNGKDLLTGAIVMTDRRLLFHGSLLLQQAEVSAAWNTVSAIDQHRQAFNTYTRVSSMGANHEFLALEQHMIDWANHLRHEAQAGQQQGSLQAPGAPSNIGDLERLVALHSSGALSDAEFVAAKAKLLGL